MTLAWLLGIPFIGKAIGFVLDTTTPLLKYLVELFVSFLNVLKEGAKDMLDNWKSVVFVAFVSAFCAAYGTYVYAPKREAHKCAKVIKDLRKDYKFVPRVDTNKDQRSVNPWM